MKRSNLVCLISLAILALFVLLSSGLSFGQPAPQNPFRGNPESGVDIDVTYISRSPRYDYDAAKNTPEAGDVVTFTARVRSRGTSASGGWDYVWFVDGIQVNSGQAPSILPGSELTVDLQYTWQEGDHWISFFADPANVVDERSEQNNLRTDRINALLIGLWVEQSVYDYFDANQYTYAQRYGITDEANSWEDWAQRQMAKWNEILEAAVYPSTPQGCLDRVRLDQVIVVPDDALPLDWGLPTNHPDTRDRTVDMMWGFETDILNGDFYSTENPNGPFNLEPSLIHEMSHARYLVDNYALDVGGSQIAVRDENGERIFPDNNDLVIPNSQGATMMGGGQFRYGEWEAAGLNVYAGQRPLPGWANFNAHAGLGKYLEHAMPQNNYLRVIGPDGEPAAGALIQIYQADEWSGEWYWYAKYIDDTVDVEGITDSQGLFNMGPNPFSQEEPIHGWNFFECIDFIKVQYDGETYYSHLDIAQVNVEFWRGNVENAFYDIQLPNCNEDVLPDQWQAEYWTYGGGVPEEPWSPEGIPSTWGHRKIRENASERYGLDESLDVNFDLYGGGPGRCDVEFDRFIVLLRKTVDFHSGTYTFTAGSDDGIKVWIDDDGWQELRELRYWNVRGFGQQTGSYTFSDTKPREVVVAFFENWGAARVKLDWRREAVPNEAPQVSAGPDQTVTLPAAVTLTGAVEDDGLPDPPGRVEIRWTKVSGPGTVEFGDPRSVSTTSRFFTSGSYVLRLTADDGELTVSDDTTVVVYPEPNAPPSVPLLEGPTSTDIGESVLFRATSTDPEAGWIRYTFDWGDGEVETTEFLPSGVEAALEHAFPAPGHYDVRVQAVDEEDEASGWSEPLTILVRESAIEVVTTDTADTYSYFGRYSVYTQQAQSFKAEGGRICKISVALARYNSPSDDVTVHLRSSVGGTDLATAIIPKRAVTATSYRSPTWVEVNFPGCITVTPGDTYYVVLTTGGTSYRNYYRLPLNRSNPYPDGAWYRGTYGQRQTYHDMLVAIVFGGAPDTSPQNTAPAAPEITAGPWDGAVAEELAFSLLAWDPDGDDVRLTVDWGDGVVEETNMFPSGTEISLSHSWHQGGTYAVRAMTTDTFDASSPWSEPAQVEIWGASGEELVISDTPTGTWYLGSSYSRRSQAQTFQAVGSSIHAVSVALARIGDPSEPISVSIRRWLTGGALASTTIDPSKVISTDGNDPSWVTAVFPSPVSVTEGSYYFVVVEVAWPDSSNYYRVGYDHTNPYPYGDWYVNTEAKKDVDMACTLTFGF